MYEFIKLQYQMGRIDKNQVLSLVPKWITADQAETIIKEVSGIAGKE